MNPRIVVATADDIDEIVSSAGALFAEDGGRRDPFMDTGWPAREGAAYYAELIGSPDAVCLLASEDRVAGHLVGRICRSSLRPGAVTGELESMRVDPAFRRRGIASALVERFIEWAVSRGANEFSVSAYSSNEAALALYGKHGFAPRSTKLVRDLS